MQYNFHQYKLIPQNYLAEETLLGIIIIYPEMTKIIKNIISENIFFIEINKSIYKQIIYISDRKEINISSLFHNLDNESILHDIGGVRKINYLMRQGQIFIFSYQLNNYIENLINLLKVNYIRRVIVQLGYNMVKVGYMQKLDTRYIYNKILYYVESIKSNLVHNSSNNITDIKHLISTKLLNRKYHELQISIKSSFRKLKSGFEKLDNIIHNLGTGNLIIIAGRPSIGKTSFAINIAYHCFVQENVNLIIFSLEMSSEQIFDKFISISSKNTIKQTSVEKVNEEDWKKLSKICHQLLKQNIYINEKPNLTINQIEFITNNLKKKLI